MSDKNPHAIQQVSLHSEMWGCGVVWFNCRGRTSESVAQFIYAMRDMFASRRGSILAPVINHGKFMLFFYGILINVCM
jgi:hypothetical protein